MVRNRCHAETLVNRETRSHGGSEEQASKSERRIGYELVTGAGRDWVTCTPLLSTPFLENIRNEGKKTRIT